MKKHFVSLLAGVYSFSSAFLPAENCCPPDLSAMDFGFYAEALYLQPTGNDIYYGVESVNGISSTEGFPWSPNWKTLEIDPDYHFGFELGAKLVFLECQANLDLNWEHFDSKDSNSFTAPDEIGFFVGPFFDTSPYSSTAYTVAHGKAKYRFDEVNLSFGKEICLTDCFHANLYGGVTYAEIEQSVHSRYESLDHTISRNIKSPSKFNGVGPQIGGDYYYQFFDQFSLIGNTTLSCFCGKIKTHTTYKSFSPDIALLGGIAPTIQKTDVKSRTQVVPSFEQKLGLLYVLRYGCFAMDFEVGYRCQVYFNAVRKVVVGSTNDLGVAGAVYYDTPDVAVFGSSLQESLSNFILSGPYATFNIQF